MTIKKTGNDLFIVDNSDDEWKVLNYSSEWAEICSSKSWSAKRATTTCRTWCPAPSRFWKELLAGFLSAAGRDRKKAKRVDFDELGTNEVVTTLRDVPMDTVLCAASMKF